MPMLRWNTTVAGLDPGTDIQSKYTFGFVMLLFSISDTGIKGSAPTVTVPVNQ